ncbi:MAG: PCRF domain-containing protein, partial [Candidatus Latescibacterota bacterium]
MARNDFWDDRSSAEQATREARRHRDTIGSWEALKKQLDDLSELREMAAAEEDQSTLAELEQETEALVVRVDDLEFRTMLSDEDDPKSAILVIHSGAGGTEAADWAEMLMRMY